MAKKAVKKDEGGGGANWMDTYGDLVTLLLTFFVMLFAFSSVDEGKLNEFLAKYVGAPFVIYSPLDGGFSEFPVLRWEDNNSEDDENSGSEEEDEGASLSKEQAEINERFEELLSQMEAYISNNGLDGSMFAMRDGDTILIRFRENMLFDSGKANLKPEAAETIVRIRTLLYEQQDAYAAVRVEGHTDNIPINNFQYPDNWYLSQDRAQSVLHKLIEDDTIPFDLAKFNASGKSEYHPIAPNDTPEGRAQNRRVDIVIERRNIQ